MSSSSSFNPSGSSPHSSGPIVPPTPTTSQAPSRRKKEKSRTTGLGPSRSARNLDEKVTEAGTQLSKPKPKSSDAPPPRKHTKASGQSSQHGRLQTALIFTPLGRSRAARQSHKTFLDISAEKLSAELIGIDKEVIGSFMRDLSQCESIEELRDCKSKYILVFNALKEKYGEGNSLHENVQVIIAADSPMNPDDLTRELESFVLNLKNLCKIDQLKAPTSSNTPQHGRSLGKSTSEPVRGPGLLRSSSTLEGVVLGPEAEKTVKTYVELLRRKKKEANASVIKGFVYYVEKGDRVRAANACTHPDNAPMFSNLKNLLNKQSLHSELDLKVVEFLKGINLTVSSRQGEPLYTPRITSEETPSSRTAAHVLADFYDRLLHASGGVQSDRDRKSLNDFVKAVDENDTELALRIIKENWEVFSNIQAVLHPPEEFLGQDIFDVEKAKINKLTQEAIDRTPDAEKRKLGVLMIKADDILDTFDFNTISAIAGPSSSGQTAGTSGTSGISGTSGSETIQKEPNYEAIYYLIKLISEKLRAKHVDQDTIKFNIEKFLGIMGIKVPLVFANKEEYKKFIGHLSVALLIPDEQQDLLANILLSIKERDVDGKKVYSFLVDYSRWGTAQAATFPFSHRPPSEQLKELCGELESFLEGVKIDPSAHDSYEALRTLSRINHQHRAVMNDQQKELVRNAFDVCLNMISPKSNTDEFRPIIENIKVQLQVLSKNSNDRDARMEIRKQLETYFQQKQIELPIVFDNKSQYDSFKNLLAMELEIPEWDVENFHKALFHIQTKEVNGQKVDYFPFVDFRNWDDIVARNLPVALKMMPVLAKDTIPTYTEFKVKGVEVLKRQLEHEEKPQGISNIIEIIRALFPYVDSDTEELIQRKEQLRVQSAAEDYRAEQNIIMEGLKKTSWPLRSPGTLMASVWWEAAPPSKNPTSSSMITAKPLPKIPSRLFKAILEIVKEPTVKDEIKEQLVENLRTWAKSTHYSKLTHHPVLIELASEITEVLTKQFKQATYGSERFDIEKAATRPPSSIKAGQLEEEIDQLKIELKTPKTTSQAPIQQKSLQKLENNDRLIGAVAARLYNQNVELYEKLDLCDVEGDPGGETKIMISAQILEISNAVTGELVRRLTGDPEMLVDRLNVYFNLAANALLGRGDVLTYFSVIMGINDGNVVKEIEKLIEKQVTNYEVLEKQIKSLKRHVEVVQRQLNYKFLRLLNEMKLADYKLNKSTFAPIPCLAPFLVDLVSIGSVLDAKSTFDGRPESSEVTLYNQLYDFLTAIKNQRSDSVSSSSASVKTVPKDLLNKFIKDPKKTLRLKEFEISKAKQAAKLKKTRPSKSSSTRSASRK